MAGSDDVPEELVRTQDDVNADCAATLAQILLDRDQLLTHLSDLEGLVSAGAPGEQLEEQRHEVQCSASMLFSLGARLQARRGARIAPDAARTLDELRSAVNPETLRALSAEQLVASAAAFRGKAVWQRLSALDIAPVLFAEDEDPDPHELQPAINRVLLGLNLQCVVVRSVQECSFSVAIGDPQLPDTPLIAVSESFCTLTGYSREEVIGQNCRFLNNGCDIDIADREGLRIAACTGKHFCALLPNTKADGSTFLNLLDMRGIKVGKLEDGQDRFFIVAIQADVSEVGSNELPLEHSMQMQHIAAVIREALASQIGDMVIDAANDFGAAKWLGEVTTYSPTWVHEEVTQLPILGG